MVIKSKMETLSKVKNIIISGTNFWNPGDDFVRDGVVKILENIYSDCRINFLFYNFNQDFFPQTKFEGISNTVAMGDLDNFSEHVDAIVIAGLSAGTEISDLYSWIIENDLYDRVYLIGAGYENAYVDKYIRMEPAATIFRNARVITGRTMKKPNFISDYNLSYRHINCPAILSVPKVKQIPEGKQIERIAFSIQLPHRIGISNHSCSTAMHRLSMQILFSLYHDYAIEVIAHHKTEYFYFLKLFKEIGLSVPVIFSSFYQDMFKAYPNYDFVISTRLHACLFANGHGIPAVIINDTDRHTECVEGFPHSQWVNSPDRFSQVFSQMKNWNLSEKAIEAEKFKKSLLRKYMQALAEPFVIESDEKKLSHKNEITVPVEPSCSTDLAEQISSSVANDVGAKRRVLSVFERLTKDHWLKNNITAYHEIIGNKKNYFDAAIFLNWYAENFKPRWYLEVGVRRGRSLAQVLMQSPQTTAFGFDMWIPDYGSNPAEGIQTSNPGPEFVLQEFHNLGIEKLPTLTKGNSHQTIPQFWSNRENPQQVDLMFVDGDHTYAGAKLDLDICFKHLSDGGALVFDDIFHPSHPELKQLWNETKARYSDYICIEHPAGMGTGVAFKPPFDHLRRYLLKQDSAGFARRSEGTVKETTVKKPDDSDLPVHFFTIVLNGEPFIRYHIEVFKRLPFKWHWHIIEGVADLKYDTAWSLNFGGRITEEIHRQGLSNDGTKEYLDELKKNYPENVTVYRKPAGTFWDGKIEMVNAPVQNINEECLLWQVDADELWTHDQICTGRDMFLDEPGRMAAYYFDHFFVGPNLTITTIDTYGNNTDYEWLRTWRFKPSYRWKTHEPPRLCMPAQSGQWTDISGINPFKHRETKARGLVFQHYAYATARQLRFKEIYYGYKDAISGWRSLQKQDKFPLFLKEYFPWVKDAAQVNTIESQKIVPLFRKGGTDEWQFELAGPGSGRKPAPVLSSGSKMLYVRTDAIGDNILAMPILEQLKKKFPKGNITVLCQEHIAELYEASPFVDATISFDKQRAYEDETYRSDIIKKLQAVKADSVLNTVYSREPLTDLFALGSGASERVAFNGNLCNISKDMRDKHNHYYSILLPNKGEDKPELERHRDFLKGIGIDSPPLKPNMWITPEDEKFADDFFKSQNLQPEKTVALFAGAQKELCRYHQYGAALAPICDENGFSVIALGAQADYVLNQENLDAIKSRRTINFCGKTTLRQTAAILKRCRLAVGADTGLAHVACAVETPNMILLGGAHFGRFLPYSALTAVICLPLDCYNCDWRCFYPRAHCISDVLPAVITEAIRQSLLQSSSVPRAYIQTDFSGNLQQPKWSMIGDDSGLAHIEIIPVGETLHLNSANELNKQGESHFSEGDLSKAREAFSRALDLAPDNAVTHNNLGVLHYNLGEKETALNHYRRATALQPENTTFQKNLADVYYVDMGQTEKALSIYVKVLSTDPEDVEALRSLGTICADLRKVGDAKEFFNRILAIEPWDKEARHSLEKLERSETMAGGDLSGIEDKAAMPSEYLVSAIVSTYNAERFIRGCLEDLEAQTIAGQLEIIVVDSGSEQNEQAIVRKMQQKYKNITYIRTEVRETVYGAWNRGIKAAHGKYVTNANTDDRHASSAFERMTHILETRPEIVLVYADAIKTETSNQTFGDHTRTGVFRWHYWDRQVLLNKGCFIGPQPMWRRNVHATYGYFDASLVTSGDYEFWLRISQTNDFFHLKIPLGLYLDRPDSIEHSSVKIRHKEDESIVRLYKTAAEEGQIIRSLAPDKKPDVPLENRSRSDNVKIGTAGKSAGGEDDTTVPNPDQQMHTRETEDALITYMEKKLQARVDSAVIHNDLGVMHCRAGDNRKAFQNFTAATNLDSESRDYLKNLADFHHSIMNDSREALAVYKKLLALDPEDVVVLSLAGHISVLENELDEAKAYYQRILDLEPANPDIPKFLKAIEQQEEKTTTVQVPESAQKLYDKVQTLVEQGDDRGACDHLEKLISASPEYALAHNDLGVLYYKIGKKEKALAAYERAVEFEPQNITFMKNLADFKCVELKQIEAAVQLYNEILAIEPDDLETLLAIGQVCTMLGKKEDAIHFFNQALAVEPWNAEIRQLLEDVERGEQSVDADSSTEEMYTEAKNLAENGKLDESLAKLQVLTAAYPDIAVIHNDLGVLHYQVGNKEAALHHYEIAAEIEPNNIVFRKNLADFYCVAQGRLEEGMQIYVDLLVQEPDDVEVLTALGQICERLEKPEDTRKFYEMALNVEPWNAGIRQLVDEMKDAG